MTTPVWKRLTEESKSMRYTLRKLFSSWHVVIPRRQRQNTTEARREALQTSIDALDVALSFAETVPRLGKQLVDTLEVTTKPRNLLPLELQLDCLLVNQGVRDDYVAQILEDCENEMDWCLRSVMMLTVAPLRWTHKAVITIFIDTPDALLFEEKEMTSVVPGEVIPCQITFCVLADIAKYDYTRWRNIPTIAGIRGGVQWGEFHRVAGLPPLDLQLIQKQFAIRLSTPLPQETPENRPFSRRFLDFLAARLTPLRFSFDLSSIPTEHFNFLSITNITRREGREARITVLRAGNLDIMSQAQNFQLERLTVASAAGDFVQTQNVTNHYYQYHFHGPVAIVASSDGEAKELLRKLLG
ncbi:hypothetical protein NMY22_g3610 [Coprinellus aureogranulatus]|nr:hypothetical protein NMY22_g3610 [Coprinellus aureogranulatus]